jgi:hypothetical protein
MPKPICSEDFCWMILKHPIEIKEGICLSCLEKRNSKGEKKMYQHLNKIEIPLFDRFYFNQKKSLFENFKNLVTVQFDKEHANNKLNGAGFEESTKTIYLEIDADCTPSTAKYLMILFMMFLDEYEGYIQNWFPDYHNIKLSWC